MRRDESCLNRQRPCPGHLVETRGTRDSPGRGARQRSCPEPGTHGTSYPGPRDIRTHGARMLQGADMKSMMRLTLAVALLTTLLAPAGASAAPAGPAIENDIIVESKDGTADRRDLDASRGGEERSGPPSCCRPTGWGGTRAETPSGILARVDWRLQRRRRAAQHRGGRQTHRRARARDLVGQPRARPPSRRRAQADVGPHPLRRRGATVATLGIWSPAGPQTPPSRCLRPR